jgi:luciferase family oxidoreductase group 1
MAPPGSSAGATLWEAVQSAVELEDCGYSRIWLAEHHSSGTKCATPEVILPLFLSATERIRVGTGGLVLPFHSPIRVVEQFLALNALFPDRLDLGVCRGPGVDGDEAEEAFRRHSSGRRLADIDTVFADHLAELGALLSRDAASRLPHTFPSRTGAPPLFVMATRAASARTVALSGAALVLSLAHCPSPLNFEERRHAVTEYRAHWRPSGHATAPRVVLAVSVICDDTREAAASRLERASSRVPFAITVTGDPSECHDRLQQLQEMFSAEEILLVNWEPSASARMADFQRLAAVPSLLSSGERA